MHKGKKDPSIIHRRLVQNLELFDNDIWGFKESKVWKVSYTNIDILKSSMERDWATIFKDNIIKVDQAIRTKLGIMVK